MTRTLCVALAIAAFATATVRAETCAEAIARLQERIDVARAKAAGVGDLPESSFATMHRQPTRNSVAEAEAQSQDKAALILDEARKLDGDGKEEACKRKLATIVMPK